MSKWTRIFDELLNNEDISYELVGETLDWYLGNIHGQFMPQAYSASSFIDKLPAILRQRERSESSAGIGSNESMDDVYERVFNGD